MHLRGLPQLFQCHYQGDSYLRTSTAQREQFGCDSGSHLRAVPCNGHCQVHDHSSILSCGRFHGQSHWKSLRILSSHETSVRIVESAHGLHRGRPICLRLPVFVPIHFKHTKPNIPTKPKPKPCSCSTADIFGRHLLVAFHSQWNVSATSGQPHRTFATQLRLADMRRGSQKKRWSLHSGWLDWS